MRTELSQWWITNRNGSEFQSVGPEAAKHLWPYLVVLEHGTARSPRAAVCRWLWLADSDTGEHSSARYVGAACCTDYSYVGHSVISVASESYINCVQQGVSLRSVCWHHEGKQFVSSLSDGSLNFWNVKVPQKPTSCMIPHCEYLADFSSSLIFVRWFLIHLLLCWCFSVLVAVSKRAGFCVIFDT